MNKFLFLLCNKKNPQKNRRGGGGNVCVFFPSMVMGNLQNKKEEGDKQKNKEKKKTLEKNVEKLEVLGNFKRSKWEGG
jgi:hypothetical protein